MKHGIAWPQASNPPQFLSPSFTIPCFPKVFVHQFLLHSSCRTENPAEADFFFVPIYAACVMTKEKKLADDPQRRTRRWGGNKTWGESSHFLPRLEGHSMSIKGTRKKSIEHVRNYSRSCAPMWAEVYGIWWSDMLFISDLTHDSGSTSTTFHQGGWGCLLWSARPIVEEIPEDNIPCGSL